MNLYDDSLVIVLKRNKRFIQSAKRGYLYEKKWYTGKGKWKQEGDSIILSKLRFVAKDGGRFSILPHHFNNVYYLSDQNRLVFDDKNNPRCEFHKVVE